METEKFYDILDSELEKIIHEKNFLNHYPKLEQAKAHAFMHWFLNFYAKGIYGIQNSIVDGSGDSSCDIIFSKWNSIEQKDIFYVVQSKWNQKAKIQEQIQTNEIKKTLNDFQTILNGERTETKNLKFNEKLKKLKEHIYKNGEIYFLFISLSTLNQEAKKEISENIQDFEKQNPNMHFRLIDIEQIKLDYIEVKYKNLNPNLLEKNYNPKIDEVTIQIERLGTNNNHILITEPFRALVFLVRPRFIYELFQKYGYDLLIENVRNPIQESEINKNIQLTLEKNPAFFWYFNNGITAITNHIPKLSKQAKEFKVQGIQIINGAQTVYSIYSVYSKIDNANLKYKLDNEVLITFRLYNSGGEDFNRHVTRYTNAQNPMKDRDFWANDPIQIRLQKESFQTKFWYERKQGEFIQVPEGISVLSNDWLAYNYLCFFSQLPYIAKQSFRDFATKGIDSIFISQKENPNLGWYELVFTEYVRFIDLLASRLVLWKILEITKIENSWDNLVLGILSLVKPVLEVHFAKNKISVSDLSMWIFQEYEKNNLKELEKLIEQIWKYLEQNYSKDFFREENEFAFLNKEIQKLKILLPQEIKLV